MKHRKIWTIVIIFLLVIVAGTAVYKMDGIYRRAAYVKDSLERYAESVSMHKEKVNLTQYEPLEDETDSWYTKYHFIAHAGGAIEGKTYTNSIQAWERTYAGGNRVFDADLIFTKDGILVLRHDWNDNLEQGIAMRDSRSWMDANGMPRYTVSQEGMDYHTFINKKIYYKYDAMSCEDMLNYMAEHEDIYVACDMKDDIAYDNGNNYDITDGYRYLVDLATEMEIAEVLDRIIVNIYNYDAYDSIMEIYDFKNVTVRQHYVSPNNYFELAEFCITHDIHVVSVSACYIEDAGIQLLREYGIHIYVAVADYISDMRIFHELGADGAVTNYLYEADWSYIAN